MNEMNEAELRFPFPTMKERRNKESRLTVKEKERNTYL